MKVTLAKTAGFCFGVSRAVEMVEREAGSGKRTVTLGPIIHNRHVVERFAAMGVRTVETPGEIEPGCTVVLRSHGVPRAVQEELEGRGLEIVDATCPFVKRIHRIVAEAEARGRQPVIIGSAAHPEVIAIAGWCEHPLIFGDEKELENWLHGGEGRDEKPITMVSQTTGTQALWKSCCKILKKVYTNSEKFDTICRATEERQKEAIALSELCEAMIIVGDAMSSNTKRLAMICSEHCKNVSLVDSADELDRKLYSGVQSVGITAGASTPAWIIKEVNNQMSDEIRTETAAGEENFAELLEQSIKTLSTGEKVTGVVTSITPTEVYVDLGTKHAGYIPYNELSSDPNVKPADLFQVGDEIEVFVGRVNDVEGTVMLSKKRLDTVKSWEEIEKACEEKTVVEGIITEENKGGLVASVKGVRVFIPASQTGIPKGGDLSVLLRQNVRMKITEVNSARRRVVGSIRAVASEERKAAAEKLWSEIEVGKKYHGVVKSLTSYGAFVDVGGVDGMVHVSELSWSRIKNPAEVVSVGDEIDVFVISYDPEKRKISLGYKTTETNPWNIFMNQFKIGDVATVKIVKMMTFGAFAEIIPGVDGLIHISQIADRRIGKPEDVLSEGQEVDVKIIDVDAENKRISLSIRALLTGDEYDADGEDDE
ncbi:MAG: bifunctional 4-hydroxy-3-methylbut-2-enyl diphosphate reductase/30S ribosomal protein S1 [Oscillospiraceae bacterium]|nr:bifunctional 4-hydroxy-3-methylbut-2-enyl diphosphate reductase/30S ribosomal protein S1 [Oscillospiraceae bacterium]